MEFLVDKDVVKRSDCYVPYLDDLGRLATGYLCLNGNNGTHLQDTNNVTTRVYIGNCTHRCICNVRELIQYSF